VPTASRPFQVFAKPAGAACNLACRYCYYVDKAGLAPGPLTPMPVDLLEAYIEQHLEAVPTPIVAFSWHGGEPTLLGLDYFRTIVSLQARHRRPGQRVINGIQTNGLLIDEEWCRFLAAERFGVGLSLDGPRDLHDGYRVACGGQPTHRDALRAYRLLRRHGIACDILCVVHDRNVEHPAAVYRFFREIGARYIGLLPLVAPDPESPRGVTRHTVPAGAYGRFLCSVFDEWAGQDVGRIAVQIFEEAARTARGVDATLCVFRKTCGDVVVVERSGDVYSCDHFVDENHRVGNIRDTPLVGLLESEAQRAFGRAKIDTLPRCCRTCEVRAMCNGGCPKDRFALSRDGEAGLNYLCEAFKSFFAHFLAHG
jgi:uncharacterized protein